MQPLTSKSAKASIDIGQQQLVVLNTVKRFSKTEKSSKTAAELADKCNKLDSYAFNRRLPELEQKGLIKNSGRKVMGRECSIKKSKCMTWWAQ